MATSTMKTAATITAAVAMIALAGCGNKQRQASNGEMHSNVAKIHKAQDIDKTTSQIRERLRTMLGMRRDGSADIGTYATPSNGQCSVLVIAVGQSATLYKSDSWALTSPNGDEAVKIVPTQGTPTAACLIELKQALGW